MRDPARIDIVLDALGVYWRKHPDLRLCQIIGNLANATTRAADMRRQRGLPEVSERVYNAEDDQVLEYLRSPP